MKRGDPEHVQFLKSRGLSDAAIAVLASMGIGCLLEVPHDGSGIQLRPRNLHDTTVLWATPITAAIFEELQNSGFIYRLTRDGEPPLAERHGHTSYRMGWLEMNLPGKTSDWYVCTQ